MASEFQKAADEFLGTYIGVYSPGMWMELERRYRKLDRILCDLEAKERISTSSPGSMTPEDIKSFILHRRAEGLKDTSISHDLSALSNLCEYTSGNHCVSMARTKYPLLFAKRRKKLLPVMEREDFDKLVSMVDSLSERSDPWRIRSYAMIMTALCGGLRTQELQYSKVANLSKDLTTLHLDHVKGMNTYGEERTVPLRPEVRHILELWLPLQRRIGSEFLSPSYEGDPLSTNGLTRSRKKVNDELGMDFDYRMCRRTYAQYLVDEGMDVDKVAVILGHASVKTTEANYARPREDRVVKEALDLWTRVRSSDL